MGTNQGSAFLQVVHLPPATDTELLRFTNTLWGHINCQQCIDSGFTKCTSLPCYNLRKSAAKKCQTYWSYYKYTTKHYDPSDSMLHGHADLYRIISALRPSRNLKKEQIIDSLVPGGTDAEKNGANSALNLVTSLMLMVNCLAQEDSILLIEAGANRISWHPGSTLAEYIGLVLPKRQPLAPNPRQEAILDSNWPLVTAKEMKRVLDTKFEGTNDISNHLRYDPSNNILPVFRHVSFLKEHLRLTHGCQANASVSDYIELGALPRQYVLEVLYSIQKIMFPLWDSDSYGLLQELISTSSLDKEVLNGGVDAVFPAGGLPASSHPGPASIIRAGEEKIEFEYLGPRLLEIYNEMQHPEIQPTRPRGGWAVWLEKRSGSRYMMLATASGVVFAIFLGMASLAVSSYQAHVALQAWQHPLTPG